MRVRRAPSDHAAAAARTRACWCSVEACAGCSEQLSTTEVDERFVGLDVGSRPSGCSVTQQQVSPPLWSPINRDRSAPPAVVQACRQGCRGQIWPAGSARSGVRRPHPVPPPRQSIVQGVLVINERRPERLNDVAKRELLAQSVLAAVGIPDSDAIARSWYSDRRVPAIGAAPFRTRRPRSGRDTRRRARRPMVRTSILERSGRVAGPSWSNRERLLVRVHAVRSEPGENRNRRPRTVAHRGSYLPRSWNIRGVLGTT